MHIFLENVTNSPIWDTAVPSNMLTADQTPTSTDVFSDVNDIVLYISFQFTFGH